MKAFHPSFVLGAISLALVIPSASADPAWWQRRGLVDLNAPTRDNAVVLIGQAKHAVKLAAQEFEDQLAPLGGAGARVRALQSSEWFADTSRDKSPLVVGQLKTLIQPFYDRLAESNVEVTNLTEDRMNPWSGDTDDDADRAPAVIGQLKFVVSFDLDKDNDDLPDWWEKRVLGSLDQRGSDDGDGDGLTHRQEFTGKTNPRLADTDGDGVNDKDDREPLAFNQPVTVEPTTRLEVVGRANSLPKAVLDEWERKAGRPLRQTPANPEGNNP